MSIYVSNGKKEKLFIDEETYLFYARKKGIIDPRV